MLWPRAMLPPRLPPSWAVRSSARARLLRPFSSMRAPEFWAGHDHMARLAIAALTPIGWAYGATVAYKAAHVKPYRSTAKVICVGNLTSGGTGKTPVAVAIARRLVNNGCKTFILTRGYGGGGRGAPRRQPRTRP